MDLPAIVGALEGVNEHPFAWMDTETTPMRGVKKFTRNMKVILFNEPRYEAMVREKLSKQGLNPENFTVSDLPWGARIADSPLILHKGVMYLQTVLSEPGESFYFISGLSVDPEELGIRPRRTNQGLEPGNEVLVATYKIENITRLELIRGKSN